MKALVKIAPIVVILACAASLFFAFQLSGQKKRIQTDLADTKSNLDRTSAKLASTEKDLATTSANLKQTQNDFAASKANLDAKDIELGQKKREAEELARAKADAEQQVADLKAKVETTEKEMLALQETLGELGTVEEVKNKISGMKAENKMLGDKVAALAADKETIAKQLEEATTTPPNLRGRVALAKAEWNFLIMDIGREQRVQPNSEYLIYRDNLLLGKARVTTVYSNSSVADLIPAFTKGQPREGDATVYKKM